MNEVCELPDGLYVARDGKLWKMDTKYIPPKDAKVVWIGGKPTNADRIRSMTDKDLAGVCSRSCPPGMEASEGCLNSICEDTADITCFWCWLDWLEQECET